MKLKGITKLVLAGTALAATAATLTTSTYAWYVTNSTAKVNGVAGSVKSESSGSLYVAKNKVVDTKDTPMNYQRSITLADTGDGAFTAEDLVPQSKVAKVTETNTDYYYYITNDDAPVTTPTAKEYYKKVSNTFVKLTASDLTNGFPSEPIYERDTSEVWVDADGKKVTPKFISFKYWLTTDSAANTTVKLKVDNTTALAKIVSQVALQSDNSPVAKDGVFYVDAVNALRMEVVQTEFTAGKTYEAASGTAVAGTKYYEKDGENYVEKAVEANADVSTYFIQKATYTAGSTTSQDYKVKEIAFDKTGLNPYASNTTTATVTNNCSFTSTDATGIDANLYYHGVLGDYPYNTTDAGSETTATGVTSWGSVTLTANKDTLFEFRIWIEGSDKDCWDSCRGQSFTFDFEFSK